MSYANLAQAQSEIKIDVTQNPTAPEVFTGNSYLIQALEFVSKRIDQETQSTFEPLIETRYFDADRDDIDFYLNQLRLDRPLLEATEVKVFDHPLIQWDGQQSTVNASDYYVTPRSRSPYYILQGIPYIQPWNPYLYGASLNFVQAYLQCISVNGIWSYREFYPREGWKLSGDSVLDDGGINDSQTTILVSDINGTQFDNASPRFSPGQLLSITTDGFTEFMSLVNTNVETETLTVIRGVRGSTATAHDEGDTIKIWYPQPEIVRATQRWVNYLYQRRAVYEKIQLQMGSGGQYSAVFPQDIPEEPANILKLFKNQAPTSIVI